MGFVASQTIFEEGQAAKAAGKAYTDDPYRAGSQDSADWLAGFTDGMPDVGIAGSNGDGSDFVVAPETGAGPTS